MEVGSGGRVDDGDVDESEIVREVELKIRADAREAEVWGLQKAGDPKPVSSQREVGSDSVVTSSDSERSEKQAGKKVSRVGSKPVATGAEGRKVVVRGKTETKARSKSEGVVRESVAELRRRGLQPERRAVTGQRG